MKRLTVLGSTGSVGEQTLAVAEEFPNRYRVVAMAAGRNVEKFAEQIQRLWMLSLKSYSEMRISGHA